MLRVSSTQVGHSSHLDLQEEVLPRGRFFLSLFVIPVIDAVTEDQDSLYMPDAILGTLFPQGTHSLVLLFSRGGRRAGARNQGTLSSCSGFYCTLVGIATKPGEFHSRMKSSRGGIREEWGIKTLFHVSF